MNTEIASLFPVGCAANWSTANRPSSANTENWLLDKGSLTQKLGNQCQSFQIKVLGQKVMPIQAHEEPLFPKPSRFLIREVLLQCENIPWVFARTLIPESTLAGQGKGLAALGESSLGDFLFSDPKLTRGEFEVAEFAQDSDVFKLAKSLGQQPKCSLWGRRSLFFLDGKPLLVAEIFLPESRAYDE